MRHVLTLIANPDKAVLQDSTVEAAEVALSESGARVGSCRWLASDTACDLDFHAPDPAGAEQAVRRAMGALPVDLVVQPQHGRQKKLLVADLESTVIENEMLDEVAARAGIAQRVAPITARAMRGEIGFADALRERVALLEGLPAAVLADACGAIRVSPGARALVATMRTTGAYAVLVSGGLDPFASYVQDLLGFDEAVANKPEVSASRLTGRVLDPLLDGEGKAAALRRLAETRAVALAETLAVGDGANDVAMVAAAGLGVAYHAKPILREAARVSIDHGDLTALLYAQGFGANQIRD
jgi:phosphoserine phosphatase